MCIRDRSPSAKGATGEHGNDGIGLKYKDFKPGSTYSRGNYVFAKSSKNSKHDSMYIAKKDIAAANYASPAEDLGSGNWVEFKAPQGERGERGATGIQGQKGDQGTVGLMGPTGIDGKQGLPGRDGATGLKGDKGDKGDQGLKGDKGDQGLKGDKGDQGEHGMKA